MTREELGDDYVKVELRVTDIRERSIFVKTRDGMGGLVIGRSLFHAASDKRIDIYRGPLPIDMVLTVKEWWVKKNGFDK